MSAINPWKLTTPSNDSGNEVAPSGTHKAVLVAIIDLGTHIEQFSGQEAKDTRKLLLAFELVEEHCAGTNRNHIIGREFTLSLHPKAGLRQFIESWRGSKFKEEEEFDITSLTGKSCMVNVTHKTSNNDRTYAVLDRAFRTNDTYKPTVKPVCWAIGEGEPPVDNWLPPVFLDGKLKAPNVKIKASQEYSGKPVPDTEAIGDSVDTHNVHYSPPDSKPGVEEEVPW